MNSKKIKSTKMLRRVGLWATIWWAVSGIYLLVIVLVIAIHYANISKGGAFSWHNLRFAVTQVYYHDSLFIWLFWLVIVVWVIGGITWLKALKSAKVSYKDGFKDLFLTIR